MALQLNSMVSVLTLAQKLRKLAVIMPFLAVGPHYRKDVAAGRLRGFERMSKYVDLNATRVPFIEFADARLPSKATCASCTGKPPPHVKCARGWNFEWCDRAKVKKACLRFDDCTCIFSVGFAPVLQKREPSWQQIRERLVFHSRFEAAAERIAHLLFGSTPYVGLQMRRGDKTPVMEKNGLTVDAVLRRAARVAESRPVIVATDDRSNVTLDKITKAGFHFVDSSLLASVVQPHHSLAAYLVDILLCVKAHLFVGTSTKRHKSKQLELIKALRRGRGLNSHVVLS